MNRLEMQTNIRDALGLREPEEQTLIQQQMWLGTLDLLRRTGCFVQCIDADVPDDRNRIEFAAAAGIQKALHILRGNVVMDRTIFPPLPGTFSQIGQILFFADYFAPGEKLQLYAVPRPPKMTSDTDTFEDEQWGGINPEYQDAIELYACSKLASRIDDNTSQMGGMYWIMYVGQDGRSGRTGEIRRDVNRTSGMTLGPARLRMAPGGWRVGYGNGNGNGVTFLGHVGPQNDFQNALAALDPASRAQIGAVSE